MARHSSAWAEWQRGTLGRAVVAAEAQLLSEACDDVFGLELLQLGVWGSARELISTSRVRRQTLVSAGHGQPADIVASAAALPIATNSIDAVLLPHTLEVEPDPGAVLREAERVLVGEGQLVELGFRPWSPWGLHSAYQRTMGTERGLAADRHAFLRKAEKSRRRKFLPARLDREANGAFVAAAPGGKSAARARWLLIPR